jgi:transposase-like protein
MRPAAFKARAALAALAGDKILAELGQRFESAPNQVVEWKETEQDRTHQGKTGCGRMPIQTLNGAKEAWSPAVDHSF